MRKTKETLPIVCVQKKGEKIRIFTNEDKSLIRADLNAFGDDIGSTTNKITEMFDVQSKFKKGSDEYNMLEYRIQCGQHYQQVAIDKVKGIVSTPMPMFWYNKYKMPKEDKFNLSIVADKKPYFFIYNYPKLKSEYKKYIKLVSSKCLIEFGKDLEELLNTETSSLNEEELNFLNYFEKFNPVTENTCTMNRLCWQVEQSFSDIFENRKLQRKNFNYELLKSNVSYSEDVLQDIKDIYDEYLVAIQKAKKEDFKSNGNKNKEFEYSLFMDNFAEKVSCICPNEKALANVLLDVCYRNNSSKELVWYVCGSVFIENLLEKHNYQLKYLELDEFGTVEYGGFKFSEKIVDVRKVENEIEFQKEINIK